MVCPKHVAVLAALVCTACATAHSVRSGFVRLECPVGTHPVGKDRVEMWCESDDGRRIGPHVSWEDGIYLSRYKETDGAGNLDGYEVLLVSGTPAICRQQDHGEACGEWLTFGADSRIKSVQVFRECPARPFPLARWRRCRDLAGAGAPL